MTCTKPMSKQVEEIRFKPNLTQWLMDFPLHCFYSCRRVSLRTSSVHFHFNNHNEKSHYYLTSIGDRDTKRSPQSGRAIDRETNTYNKNNINQMLCV